MPRMFRDDRQTCYIVTDSSTDLKLSVMRAELEQEIKDSKADCTLGATLTVSDGVQTGTAAEGQTYSADTKIADVVKDICTANATPTSLMMYVYESIAPLEDD